VQQGTFKAKANRRFGRCISWVLLRLYFYRHLY